MKDGVLPLGVIPARAGSSRFPRKILASIDGKPMICHVWEAAKRAKRLGALVVATDDEAIARVVRDLGGRAVLTSSELPSGTDRVACVARESRAEIIVNLQGDEPLLSPESIDRLVEELEAHPDCQMATLAILKRDEAERANPNVVKIALGSKGEALYFSRQPLGYGASGEFLKHIGIYAYRRDALLRLCALPPSPLESLERLEQLRALEDGMRIRVAVVTEDTVAVDTLDDIARVEALLAQRRAAEKHTHVETTV